MNEPQLPRRRKAPRRIEECVSGTAQAEFPTTVEAHYRTVYYEALDLVTSCIKTRFDQEDYKIHSACESLLLKTVTGEDFTDFTLSNNFTNRKIESNKFRFTAECYRLEVIWQIFINVGVINVILFALFHKLFKNVCITYILKHIQWVPVCGLW